MLRDARLPGVTDVVPSFCTVAIHYRPDASADSPSHGALAERIGQLLAGGLPEGELGGREIDIPVCYGGEHGPDGRGRRRGRPDAR